MEITELQKTKIKEYEDLNYEKAKVFLNEYVLMYRWEDGRKVRIYEDGKVWEY